MQTLTITANDEIIETLKAFIDNFADVQSSVVTADGKVDNQVNSNSPVIETTAIDSLSDEQLLINKLKKCDNLNTLRLFEGLQQSEQAVAKGQVKPIKQAFADIRASVSR